MLRNIGRASRHLHRAQTELRKPPPPAQSLPIKRSKRAQLYLHAQLSLCARALSLLALSFPANAAAVVVAEFTIRIGARAHSDAADLFVSAHADALAFARRAISLAVLCR